ncbi:MbnP family protein [Longitalea luteola]|uniref:MbnP family protein n=1 Tax=Longitalea luteola TaxID=2812563 RepID=UPI001A959A12|nr:MbnP family protein [Longitalea luteola]
MKITAGWMVLVAFVWILNACQKDKSRQGDVKPVTGSITFSFDHAVFNEPLVFGRQYTNDLGEAYTVNRFKYYIHGIKLINSRNEPVGLSEDYFLVDHENAASRNIRLTAPVDSYTSIAFILGVDSAKNVSGAQTGALDPVHGMFWTWASGYVMAKLEGHSPVSPLSGQAFTLHVGGFKSPYITFRQIGLPLPENLVVVKDTSITVKINADINTWFSRIHPVSISKNPACHSPGQLANDIADNYEGMFSVTDVF